MGEREAGLPPAGSSASPGPESSPSEGPGRADTLDLGLWQELQDSFAWAAGVASLITTPEGRPLTRPSNFSPACRALLLQGRGSPCRQVHAEIGRQSQGEPWMGSCPLTGLATGGAALLSHGRHVATWVVGEMAPGCGPEPPAGPEAARAEALARFARERFGHVCETLFLLAGQLSSLDLQNRRLAQNLEELARVRARLERADQRSEVLIDCLRTAPLAMVLWEARDHRFQVLEWNQAAEEMFGWSREEMLARGFLKHLPTGQPARLGPEVTVQLGSHIFPNNQEHPCPTRDGRIVTVKWFNTPLPHPSGEGSVVLSLGENVTERREAAAKLRKSEERYRLLAENVLDVLWQTDRDLRFTYISPSCRGLLGYTPEEMMTTPLERFCTPDSFAVITGALEQGLRDGLAPRRELLPRVWQLEHIRRDGKRIWVETTTSLLAGPDGQVQGLIGVMRDITGRRETEKRLRWESRVNAALARLANTLISSPNGHESFARLLLATARELTGSAHACLSVLVAGGGVNSLISEDDAAEFRIDGPSKPSRGCRVVTGRTAPAPWGRTLFAGEAILDNQAAEGPRSAPSSERPSWWNLLAVPVRLFGELAGQLALAGAPRDYTPEDQKAVEQLAEFYALALNRARAHETHEQLENQLRQAQKMEALGTLAGGIAHDFNNLLNVILGFGELALDQAAEGTPAVTEISQILKAAGSARELVRRILAFSRRLEPRLEPLDLNREVGQAAGLLSRTLPKMITMCLDLAPDLYPIKADPNQIEQVLLNLAANARDAMPRGGHLTLETSNVDRLAELSGRPEEPLPGAAAWVRLTVRDTGEGMDEATRRRIFDPFFTTKEKGRGTGLGLSTVYGIVKGHSGQIWCDSSPGEGAAFSILLPAGGQPRSMAAPAGERTGPVLGGPERVLLVDDEDDLRDLGRRILSRAGYTVVTAASGEEALEACAGPGGLPDLVILDLGMPGMGGESCLTVLKAAYAGLPVLVASGYADQDRIASLYQRGAGAFVSKPFGRNEILGAVRRLLDG